MSRGWWRAGGASVLAFLSCATVAWSQTAPDLQILFLGDHEHHQPVARFKQLQPEFQKRAIDLSYTDSLESLNSKTLAPYDGLMIYANHPKISADQEQALLGYVEGGKGLILLHCASFCFLNSPRYIALAGAQFERHGTGVFGTKITAPEHSVMQGFRGFESWDETYVHHLHNQTGRTVLETRDEGDRQEPWTWVRTQGKGRVFYTAWGHDERTWGNPGFQNLVERGTRWACGKDPAVVPAFSVEVAMTAFAEDAKPFEYVPASIPFYPPSKEWGKLADPFTQMQKPLAPEESVKHMVTPVGFRPELFVAEPDLQGKPISMNWDERGRLWVCETVDYPNDLQSAGAGARPDPHLRGHRRRRQGGSVHGLRGSAQHPHQHRLPSRRDHRSSGSRYALSPGYRRRRRGRRAAGSLHGLAHRRYSCWPQQPPLRP